MTTQRIIVLSLYPEMFSSFLSAGLLGKALEDEKIQIDLVNFRAKGFGKHHHVDDTPYGGGAGMVLRIEPIVETLNDIESSLVGQKVQKVLLSPRGVPFSQARAREYASVYDVVILICGRFEGVDERIRHYIDEEISLGDFVMMGGEVGAMAVIESVARLVPGVIGNSESLESESFSQNVLEYAQYTRPAEYESHKVPDVLLSGNHQKIKEWRENNALEKTKENRMDMYHCLKNQTGQP